MRTLLILITLAAPLSLVAVGELHAHSFQILTVSRGPGGSVTFSFESYTNDHSVLVRGDQPSDIQEVCDMA